MADAWRRRDAQEVVVQMSRVENLNAFERTAID